MIMKLRSAKVKILVENVYWCNLASPLFASPTEHMVLEADIDNLVKNVLAKIIVSAEDWTQDLPRVKRMW